MADLGTLRVAGADLPVTSLRLGGGLIQVDAEGPVPHLIRAGSYPVSVTGPDGLLVTQSPAAIAKVEKCRPGDHLNLHLNLDVAVTHG